jgi:hypothetical protein
MITNKPSKNTALTEVERHRRFLDAAEKAGASGKPEDFDLAFKKVVKATPKIRADSKNASPVKGLGDS